MNAAVCAMVEVEPCKFNPYASSCVSSVNPDLDDCNTPGLNNLACGLIKKAGYSCVYNTVSWMCVQVQLDSADAEVQS